MAASPVAGLLERIDRGASKKIVTELTGADTDFFEISSRNGKPLVRGNNWVSIAAGVNWYLKYYAGIHLSWNGMKAALPKELPLPATAERRETDICWRYDLNYCTYSYSMAFWDWERWEREIDWMALHGINLPLAAAGQEQLWANFLSELSYPAADIEKFIAGPGFMAWLTMGNLESWGGPVSPGFREQQCVLQQKILARMREYGMEPVLPGYFGMLPHDAAEKLGLDVSDPGLWNRFDRPSFLLPTDSRYDEIAGLFYAESEKLYGKARFYSMDPFHEGGGIKGVDLKTAGESIMQAMKRNDPEAVWVIQAWQINPRRQMIENLAAGDLLVLDLYSETQPQWGAPGSTFYREGGYGHHDWVYCMLLNFGGNVGLHGKMGHVIDSYYQARNDTNAGATMRGVGMTMEGIENNPVMYELLTELPWRTEKFGFGSWIADWVFARYGQRDSVLTDAWLTLARSIYNCPPGSEQQGTTESVFCGRPAEVMKNVSSWADSWPYYDPHDVIRAAELFASVATSYCGNNNYEYDLVDIVRQAVAEVGRIVQKEMTAVYWRSDAAAFENKSSAFLDLIMLQDELLGTRSEFMVGKWIADARNIGTSEAEKDLCEWNARMQITTWGDREAADRGGLHDYAHREWNGILRSLYYKRWKLWVDLMKNRLVGNRQPDIDFYPIEEGWVRGKESYPAIGMGDPTKTAAGILTKAVSYIR